MSFDPLYTSTALPSSSVHPPPDDMSPFAPRSPLPGQQSGHFRPSSLASPIGAAPDTEGWGDNQGFIPRDARVELSLERERASERALNASGQGRLEGAEARVAPTGFVRIKVVGLEKNRRDIYIKFNAESNLPTYRSTTYRAVSRSYTEFLKLVEALAANNPQTIIPALPLSQTSAMTEEEDDRMIKASFQRWFGRILGDGVVVKDEELRGFIENDFGYTPTSKLRRKTPSTFHFPRGSRPPDMQDDTLTLSKSATSHLELSFLESAKVVEKLAKARRAVGAGYEEVGERLGTFAATEVDGPLAGGWKKLSRTVRVMGDLQGVLANSEMVTLGDALSYQATNSRAAKDTLVSRDVIVGEHRSAVKATRAKRDAIERLKNSSSIKADRVDEALDELEEAKKYEQTLYQNLQSMSHTLQPSLETHSRNAHEDVLSALLEHARSSLLYERQLLKEFELLRPELTGIRKMETGVTGVSGGIYYHPTSPGTVQGSPRAAASNLSRASSIASSSAGPPSSSAVVVRSASAGPRPPSADDASLRSASSTSTMGRSTMNTPAKRGAVPDQRQRVDSRMAASMLANGF